MTLHMKGQTLTTEAAFPTKLAAVGHQVAMKFTHVSLIFMLTEEDIWTVQAMHVFT